MNGGINFNHETEADHTVFSGTGRGSDRELEPSSRYAPGGSSGEHIAKGARIEAFEH
jgi:hypothetical protein